MIFEKKAMEPVGMCKGNTAGHITLSKLAIPETVAVTFLGRRIEPFTFDCYGHPYFTEEQWMYYFVEQKMMNMYENTSDHLLELEVYYQEKLFTAPRSSFDTVEGITTSLDSLFDLNKMLANRKIFARHHKLNQFMLFGCFFLDQFGQVMSIERTEMGKLVVKDNVEEWSTFKENNPKDYFLLADNEYAIPIADSVCPLCGSKFTIDDLKYNPCVCVDGKFYHDSCWRKYRRAKEIYDVSFTIMAQIYGSKDYKFDLLPNGYCHEDCCSHIPWFLFHTIDGDIVMGWRKRVISIEWQGNYKPFDMKELFGEEDVTKWEEGEKRGIHAWGEAKAIEYLRKVRETVNPDYRGW